MKRTALYAVYLISLLLGHLSLVAGQVATGTPPFGSFGGGPVDTVNLGNLNAHFTIPVFQKAGRGMPFAADLGYDTSVWYPVGTSGSQTWQPVANFGWTPWTNVEWGYLTASVTVVNLPNATPPPCNPPSNMTPNPFTIYGGWTYIDRVGVAHPFYANTVVGGSGCPTTPASSTMPALAVDGSGYSLNASGSSGTVTTRDGRVLTVPINTTSGSASAQDSNGNQVTVNSSGQFTDTLGQSVMTLTGSGTPSSPIKFGYTSPSGATVYYAMNYTAYNVKTNFGCSGIAEYTASSVPLVSSINLPDGTSYSFTYETTLGYSGYITGRLASVTLPTGGAITYTYPTTNSGANNGITCADGSANGLTRVVNPGTVGPTGTWTYTRTARTSGNLWTTTVSDPSGNQTAINFSKDASTSSTNNFYETQRQAYQGTSTLLLTTVTCYNTNTSGCGTATVSSPITQIASTLQYPSSGLQTETVTSYSSYGMTTQVDQYAYASGTPTTLLQSTQISYASMPPIYSLSSSVSVYDGSSNLKSKTTSTYDEYTTYPLQTTTGTPNHVTPSGPRGNLTSVYFYTSSSASLAKHFQYFDTGTIYKTYDVNGAQTTYTYGTTAQGTTTISCGNSFPTSITLPITSPTLSTSTVWNCTGGVATSTTDVNGNSSSVTYSDPYFWRPASTADAASNTTNFTYTAAGTSNPASVESSMLFNTSNSSISDQLTTVDGFGRTYLSQQKQSPTSTSYDTSQTNYDSFGRPYQGTMPYVGTAGQTTTTTPLTAATYDALGRVTQTTDGGGGYVSYAYNQNDVLQTLGPAPTGENTKQKQLEYDALGRLTSVCEITSGTGNGACAQTTPSTSYNGYWTKYVYDFSSPYNRVTVTQNAQSSTTQTRTFLYDLLGRLVSETNPENATTTYSFDSASSCTGTYNGDLVKRVDANSTRTCYAYDALHRLTSVTYSDTTPTKTLVYDAATLSGTAMSNAKGQMAEAYTGSSGSKITDDFFSYSVRGELTDTYESTPHSGSTYYHVTAGFWANGALNSLTSNLTGVPSQTYGVDGEGRAYSVTAGSGQNPVTSTSYNLSTYVNTVTFGSLDSDKFTLDPNTGRMTEYNFSVGSLHDYGDLTWNANGSLKKLAIHDALNTPDTQTCNYTHDDLSRIASANCGSSIWSQTFTYDSFGNITKNVPTGSTGISFVPGYSTTTNQFTLIGSLTPTYDADGRLTYDGNHNYGWDAESKMVSVDTTTTTYDALGRMVENNVSGTYTQIVYSPLGKKFALMNGSTLQKAYVPLPGAQAIYTSAGLAYYRHSDHLGNSRLATTSSRTLYSSTAYGPYGEPYNQAGTTDLSFTGQDQDTVSGMHDFLDRKYTPVQGRWLTPDPAGFSAVDPSSPQSWNRYAYVNNNPLAMVDPFGDDGCYDVGGGNIHCDVWAPLPTNSPYSVFQLYEPYQGPAINGGGGGGSGIKSPAPPKPACSIVDPVDAVWASFEYTVKAGPEGQVGPVKVGYSFYKNLTTGDTGGKGELNAFLFGLEVDSKTPQGGSFGACGPQCNEYSLSLVGFQYNFTTHQWSFDPSKSVKLGVQVVIGGEISFNSDTYSKIMKASDACAAQAPAVVSAGHD